MALPFLQDKKSIADVIASGRRPDGENEEREESEESNETSDLQLVSQELIDAVHAKDAAGVAAALQAAHDLCNSQE